MRYELADRAQSARFQIREDLFEDLPEDIVGLGLIVARLTEYLILMIYHLLRNVSSWIGLKVLFHPKC